MANQETFKEWLPIDGREYGTPYGVYTVHLIEIQNSTPDRSLSYTFRLTCPGAGDHKMTIRVYAEQFSREASRNKILGIVAMRVKNTDQSDMEIDLRNEEL